MRVPAARAPAARAAVRVPASTSNLGAGFDCVGVALDWWLTASATFGDATFGIDTLGDATLGNDTLGEDTFGEDVLGNDTSDTHAASTPRVTRAGALAELGDLPAGDDLLVRGFVRACAAAGRPVPPGLTIDATSDIPVARGLGSSAAALAAGALLADALFGLGLGARGAAALCATLEGHPDNAAPACLGGAVLGVPAPSSSDDTTGGAWTLAPLDLHPGVAFALAVPDFTASTAAMRRVLPAGLPHHDAVRAAGKAAALVRGLATADGALLAWALDDVLHVPYRRALVPGYDAVCAAARRAGAWGATLSGAGSSIVALVPPARAVAAADAMAVAWQSTGVRAQGWAPGVAGGAEIWRAGDRQGAPPGTGGSGPASSSGVTSSAGIGRANR